MRPDVSKQLITIGQLAGYAGVTIKAVRHYHRVGLLDEPVRDTSGYRRYTAQHAIALVKIRTLADAGVPLARVKELLAADPQQFASAVADIDRSLRERAAAIRRARTRIAQLNAGDSLFVSADLAAYLGRLRKIGVKESWVATERDLWILMQAVSPEAAAGWVAEKFAALKDPEFRSLYLAYLDAHDWSPDDPRLERLADRTERWMLKRSRRGKRVAPATGVDPAINQLIAASTGSSPAWARLSEIGAERRTRSAG
jgi:DNA-binding transcriptional MerR regulator